jgi:hypothetical protein
MQHLGGSTSKSRVSGIAKDGEEKLEREKKSGFLFDFFNFFNFHS